MRSNCDLQNLLKQSVGEILRQGAELLREIDDDLYAADEQNAYASGGAVGGHFRHCLEFITCFLNGAETGKVDYNERKRDQQIETQREYAISKYLRTIDALGNFSVPEDKSVIFVKPEDVARDADFWCASSVTRELEFLHSHTIHHYALIGFKLRARGFAVSNEFGVAPSTLRFWAKVEAAKV